MPTEEKGTLIGAILELGESRRTGVLSVRAEDVKTSIVFDGGAPIDAIEEGTPGEPLGRLLVRTRVLTSEQHAKVIDAMASSLGEGKEQKFGEAAIALGILTAEKLEHALREQVRWRIVRALQRDGAAWTFADDDKQVHVARRHELSLDSIVLDASRWFSDARRRAVVEGREPFFVSLRGSANAVARRFGMTPEEQLALEAFDGTETVADLVSVEPSTTGIDVSALLVALISSGVVELSDSPRQPGPHPPRASRAVAGASSPPSQPPRANDRIARTVARLKQAQAQLPASPPLERRPQNEREARVFAEQSFQHGQAHLRANRLQQAVPLLRRAFGLMPKNLEYELYAMWTEVRVRHEKPTPAQLSALRNIAVSGIRQDPNLAFAYYVLGHVTLLEGSEVMAKRHFSHALRLDPEAIDAERHIRVLKRREAKGSSRVPQVMRSKPPPALPPPLPAMPPQIPEDRTSGQAVARVALKKVIVDSVGARVERSAVGTTKDESFGLYDKPQKTLELPADMTTPLPGQITPIVVPREVDRLRSASTDSPLPDGPSSLTAVSRVAEADRASPPPSDLATVPVGKPPEQKPAPGRTRLYAGASVMASVLVVAFVMVSLRANRMSPPSEPPRAAVNAPMPPPSTAPPPVSPIRSARPLVPPPVVPAGAASSPAAPSVTPPATSPSSAAGAKEGTVVLPKWAAQRRIYVDGRLQGDGASPIVVGCGSREIKIGSSGKPKTLQVPCAGSIEW